MTLRTALVIDGNSAGAEQAVDKARDAMGRFVKTTDQAQTAANGLAGAAQHEQAALGGATAALRTNTAAQAANNTMTRQAIAQRTNLIFQLNDIFVSLASGQAPAMVAIQQGSQISTIYGPGGLGKALSETGKLAVGAATKFAPLLAVTAAVSVGIAGLTYEINRTRDGIDVSFGDTALAILQTFGDYLWDYIKPAVTGIADWFNEEVWPAVTSGTADTINGLVRGWMGFLAEMELIAGSIAHVFDGAWALIYNGAITMLEELLKSMWLDINKMLVLLGQQPVKVDLSSLKMEADSGWSKELLDQFNDRKKAIAGTDYAGQFFSDVADNAQQNAINGQKKKKGGKQNDYAREIAQIRERTAALQVETNVIGLSTFAAEKARKVLELETAARKDATGLTTQRIAEIQREATAYATAAATLEQRKSAWQSFSQAGSSAFDSLTDSIMEGGKNIGDTVNQIIKDFAKLALQMAIINPIKNALFGSNDATFAGLGGVFSTLFGGGGFTGTGGGAATLGNVGSWAGGGPTGRGPRSGGMDGQGGFLAMLHPQETVVDHAAGQGMGGVVININNTAGADVSARQTGTDSAGQAMTEIAVAKAVERVEGKMAKGNYRPYGVGPGLRRP